MSQKVSLFIILPLVFLLFLIGFVHPLTAITQDLGRHVLLGKIMWTTHTIPSTNLLTYTYPDFPFLNHHWLSEVLFYLIASSTSFSFLGACMIFVAFLSFCILIWYAIQKSYNPLAIGIFTVFSLQVIFERTDTRPEIFGWLLLSLMLVILYSYKKKFTKWIFLLPVLQLLWVNLHITFLVGLIVQGLFLIDAIITYRKNLFHNHIKVILLICLLSFGASLLNPHGIQGALYPLTVFNNYGYSIEENQNIFFLQSIENKLTIKYFYASILILFTSLLLCGKRSRVIDWILAVTFTFLGFYAIRNFPLFVFIVFIPAIRSLSLVFDTWTTHSHLFKRYGQYIVWVTFLGFFTLSLFQLPKRSFSLSLPPLPDKSVDFFQSNHLSGPIFNNFDIGSFLEYRLYPQEKLFIDGRPEAFPASFIQNTYIPMQQSPELFEKEDEKYHFNTIIFSHSDQTPWAVSFVQSIATNKRWKFVYLSSEIMILVKDIPENRAVLAEYGKTLENIPVDSDGSFRSNQLLSRFFTLTQTPGQATIYLTKLLAQDPNYCPAIQTLASIYTAQKNPAAYIYQSQSLQKCQ